MEADFTGGGHNQVHPGRSLSNSADAGELLAAEHGEDALSADRADDIDNAGLFIENPPDNGSTPTMCVVFHQPKRFVRIGPGDISDQPSLVGYIQRVETEHLAERMNAVRDRNPRLVNLDCATRDPGDLAERSGEAAAREVAQAVDLDPGIDQREHELGERRRIALDHALEAETLAHGHDRHPMTRDIAVDDEHVAGLYTRGGDNTVVLDNTDSRGVDEHTVPFATFDDLGVAGDDLHPGIVRGQFHRADNTPEGLHRQPLLENETGREVEGPGPGHREVIDRAVNGERTDVAAWEENRADHIGIGGHRQSAPAHLENRGVMTRGKRRVVEGFDEHRLDKPMHQRTAAAMGEQNVRVFADRYGTGKCEIGFASHGFTLEFKVL